ncbi:MAG: hypothetical protein WC297_02185 [Candidatus Paceibacterota bacterium]|jgi:hypothetical protein
MENFEKQPEKIEDIEAEIKKLHEKAEGLLLEIPEEKMSDKVYDAWWAADSAVDAGINPEEIKGLLLNAIKLFEREIEAEKAETKE